ncbi:hypothetical protein PTSG_04688 [Salpingoeca rosetta]|uniref:RIH domain-containing protein n=1 Tax=Salpingoeca rosetta (strain ATCC 50818 / BSB-021) TaxID=946362 RepID=F2U852_SALR5|nr:uncharacterized protein PTSG_04688 [Salpingoeca rosetta]EGD72957.1 hypothetical protein PTSG_04688 [Salpingoeca rosetta]|eukprot:XP_004994779.1 hypothetical protein PTSG_04688 [Salpingoeca rosetta]
MVTNALAALRDLESFMFRDNKPVRERQKLLRNFHVVDKLVELLSKSMETRAGLDPGHGHTKTPKHVLNAACNVLKAYVVGNSRKNEHYLAKHIPFFQEHMGAPLEIESLYTELVRDDLQVVDSLKEDDVKQIVQKLKRMSSADNAHSDKLEREFLMFLGVLCVCEDTPVPSKQNTIARLLFDDEHDHVDVTRLFPSFIVPDPPEDQLGDAPFLTDEHKVIAPLAY